MRDRPKPPSLGARLWLIGAAVALLAGCSRPGADWRTERPDPQKDPPATGYVRPPQVGGAARSADGGTVLSGAGEPDVRLRLASPDGGSYGATADDGGRWSIALPPTTQVRLFGLSEELAGRVIQGEGYIAVLPAPGRPAVLLRAGAGAAPLEDAPAPQIIAVDFDAAGGGVVSGAAAPGSAIRGLVDGAAAGETHAGPHGRYSMALAATLKAGAHHVQIQSPAGTIDTALDVSRASEPLTGLPYRGQRLGDRWRIDWLTPGGGPQTTVVFDAAGAAPGATH
ncbi:MAG: hypothetical protein P4L73_12630 [Caulobacteraceae bacterium]|nr:hypothetical protein [Caulobacteraceae bacterium]